MKNSMRTALKRIVNRAKLSKLGIRPQPSSQFLLDGYAHVAEIVQAGGHFEVASGRCELHFDGIVCPMESGDDLYILWEVFSLGVYNFQVSGQTVVMDIGMHVGYASLFFASLPGVMAVYAFEPFPRTYEQAMRNFERNPHLRKKIHPYNYGLGAEAAMPTYLYNYRYKGNAGHHGLTPHMKKDRDTSSIDVNLKPVDIQIRKLRETHPTANLAVKMDCEGAEYALVEKLASEEMLQLVDLYMIEWHEKGGATLLAKLQRAGFKTIVRNPKHLNNGFIYAFQ